MIDTFAVVGAISACIGITTNLIKAIDFARGCCTKNTPAAALWVELLSRLKTEISNAQVQLRVAEDEVEPMRFRRGSGAAAANRMRQGVKFDDLIEELATQLKASEKIFLTATNEFKERGIFNWALLEAFDTKARESTAPMKDHCQEIKRLRGRIHEARQSIINAFLLNVHDSSGGQFPAPESLGTIRDKLAHGFLWDDPFCQKIDPEDESASGLLMCNKTDLDLKELRRSIEDMGQNWVRLRDAANRADGDAANNGDQRRTSTTDVLEGCQNRILVNLHGVFNAIINVNGGPPFTPDDFNIATRGRCALNEWSSICVAAERGIVIALGGKVSAGKSSIINALLGQSLLPVAQRICTAVPCRLVHESGRTKPTLSIPWLEPYVECLEWIKVKQPSTNYLDYEQWTSFASRDPAGKKMLAKIEGEDCPELKEKTEGGEAIDQMAFLNCLVRICRTFGKEVNLGYPIKWPTLSIEFTGLKHYCENLPGSFTLLDLPGYNDDINVDSERFKELMTRAAKQADVMVPVIAGTSVETGGDWAKNIIRDEWSTKISSAIITKLDVVESKSLLRRNLPVILKKCELLARNGCILFCDSLTGLEAMKLQRLLEEIERKYAQKKTPKEGQEEENAIPKESWEDENAILTAAITNKENSLNRLYEEGSKYANFTIKDWGELVEASLDSSQIRQTCDKLAATTIEEARRLRLSRFIGEMEDILKALISSLSVALCLNRASLDKLYETQRQTEKTLSDLRDALRQWKSRIDEVRVQQDGNLNKVLRKFEETARDSADKALEMSVRSVRIDGGVYLLGQHQKAEKIIKKCRAAVLGRLDHAVDEAIGELCEIWKENQDAVLSLLRNATVNIETNPYLAEIIKNAIDQLEKIKELDPKKLRLAMSGTPGEVVVEASSNKIWGLLGIKPAQTPGESKRLGKFSRFKQTFDRSGGTSATASQSAPSTPRLVSPSSTPVACREVSAVNDAINSESPPTNFVGLAAAMITPNMEDNLRGIISEVLGSVPSVQEIAEASRGNPSDNAGVKAQGPVKMNQETLRKCVFSASLEPLISRIKDGAESCLTESLNEMTDLAQQAVLGALEECHKVVERQMEALESDDTKQFRAETLQRLVCWGNLVAAQGVIEEMRRKRDEPVPRISDSYAMVSPSPSSPSPIFSPFSFTNRVSNELVA